MKIKRNISLLLVLSMVLSMVLGISAPTVAHAETNDWTTISEVQLSNIPVAEIGQSVTQADANLGITGEENAGYTVEANWIDDATGNILTNGDTFQDENSYQLSIHVRSDDGYGFSEDAILMLDEILYDNWYDEDYEHNYDYAWDEETGRINELYVYIRHSFCEVIDSVDVVGIPTAEVGGAVVESTLAVPEGEVRYKINEDESGWFLDGQESFEPLDEGDVFENKQRYELRVVVEPEAGYEFSENTTITLDGNESSEDDYYAVFSEVYWSQTYSFLEKIDTVEVSDVPTAEVGSKASVSGITLPTDANYEINEELTKWYDITEDEQVEVPDGTAFQKNHAYMLDVEVDPKEGYAFSDDTVLVIDGEVVASGEYNVWEDSMNWSYEYSFLEKIDKIELTNLPAAKVGEKASVSGITVPKNANYIIDENNTNWFDSEGMMLEADAVFEKGEEYTLNIVVAPTMGYEITEDAVITVNGESTDNYYINSGKAYVYQRYSFLEKIDKIEITNVPTAEVGGKATYEGITIPADANYKITYISWYNWITGEELEEGATFEKGNKYSFDVNIEAEEGYEFSDDVIIMVNGKEEYKNAHGDRNWAGVSYVYSFLTPIDKIEILDELPNAVAGQKAEPVELKVPEDAKYSAYAEWYTKNDGMLEYFEGTFESGKAYTLEVYVEADLDKGYGFAEDVVVTVAGKSVSTVFVTNHEEYYVITEVHDLGDNTISTVEITAPEPKAGAEITDKGIKVPEDAKYELEGATWYDVITGKEVKGKFEEGKKYELFLSIEPKDNLLFANDLKIMLNGKEVAIAELSEDSSLWSTYLSFGVVYDLTVEEETQDTNDQNTNVQDTNNQNTSNQDTNNQDTTPTPVPDTGDTTNLILWIAVAAISVGSIVVVANSKKRYNA